MSPVLSTVKVADRRMDAEHYRVRDFLTRTAQPYEWHEAGSAEADALLGVAAAVGEGSMVAALVFTRLAELGVTV